MRVTEPYTIFPRTFPSGRTVYYYRYRDESGVRSKAKSTGCTTEAAAKRYCNKLYRNNSFSSGSVYFGKYVENFFSEDSNFVSWKAVSGNPLAPETIRSYKKALEKQLLPYFNTTEIEKITVTLIKKWIIWASEADENGQRKWSAKTVNNAQSVLSLILKQAVEDGLLEVNPCRLIEFRRVLKKERSLLTAEEISRIYSESWFRSSAKTAFIIAVCTGMRIGEVCALRKSDISDQFIHVKASYSDRSGLGSTKTKQNRYVPIPKQLYNLILAGLSDSEWVITGLTDDMPLLSHNIYNSFCRICDKLEIDRQDRGITIHSLRNFFISFLQAENIPQSKIRAVVGHKDSSMTGLYTYWTPDMFPEIYTAQEKLLQRILT